MMSKKQVIMVLHSLAVGGAERRVSSIANYMANKGISVKLVLIDSPEIRFMIAPEIEVVCINQSVDKKDYYGSERCTMFQMPNAWKEKIITKLKLRIYKIVLPTKASVLETELYLKKNFALPLEAYLEQYPEATVISFMTIPNLVTMMAARNLKNRAVFSDCTSPEFEYPPESPFCVLRKRYYSRAQAAVFQTEEEGVYYTFLPNVKKYIIPNFIRGEMLPERYEGVRKKVIVNFCRLNPIKNIPLLIDAFEMLHKEYPEYVLNIYGEGEIRGELKAYIQRKGLQEAVFIYDFNKDIHQVVRDAAMFVSSSDREGISNSMLEAMAIGLPTICTDCPAGGARMMIKPYENGLLVPVRNKKALYLAMKEVIQKPELATTMSENAVKIKEELRIDKICEKWISVI